jgi:hypothetical protein
MTRSTAKPKKRRPPKDPELLRQKIRELGELLQQIPEDRRDLLLRSLEKGRLPRKPPKSRLAKPENPA